ncbi:MAG: Na+/H+ antiporter subunit E [Desulfuromonadaceae bacterium]|nr:Na+/H+ antiporter subunit E [Desulfuromonas sp.]MDY0185455.1 Na+/H+ antiporter subunit E [Desulfuromonadaceae bacterium]
MLSILFLTLILSLFWLLLSWQFAPFVLGCGVVSIALTLYLAQRMRVVDAESLPLNLSARIVWYWLWLAKEVALSNWDVARHIWGKRIHINPRVIQVKTPMKTPFGLMLYANSITLTPGTVCIDIEDGQVTAHALTDSAAAGLESGEMGEKIRRLGL